MIVIDEIDFCLFIYFDQSRCMKYLIKHFGFQNLF